VIGLIAFLVVNGSQGGGKKGDKELPRTVDPLYLSLKDVINRGAKIFNEDNDHAGCYRLFEGALLGARPFIDRAMQDEVDKGLAAAAKMPSYTDKAFELRRVLDLVRAHRAPDKETPKVGKEVVTKDKEPGTEKSVKGKETDKSAKEATAKDKAATDKGPADKEKKDKTVKKGKEKKKLPKDDFKPIDPEGKGNVVGKVTIAGKPVTGRLTFHQVDGKKSFEAKIMADGTFELKDVPAGKYRITVHGEKGGIIPDVFSDPKTSALIFRVSPGDQRFEIMLVNKK
jgi:hypothetical protein